MPSNPSDSSNFASVSDARFVTLEEKMAYLEKLAADLNEVVTSQADLIDRLENRVKLLETQAVASGEGREFPHEAPPHY